MSLSADPPAARQEKASAMEIAAPATGPSDRCSRRNAPSAARIHSYPSSHVETSRCTAAIATAKSESADRCWFDVESIHRVGVLGLCNASRMFEVLCHWKLTCVKTKRRNHCCGGLKERVQMSGICVTLNPAAVSYPRGVRSR